MAKLQKNICMRYFQTSSETIIKSLKNFILSPHFGDGLRITFGVVLPSLIASRFGLLQLGISISLGALCISIVDSPGPYLHRRNAMFLSILLIGIISLITSFVSHSFILKTLLILSLSFLLSMLYVYGQRASSMGVAGFLVMIISIDDIRPSSEILQYSGLIIAGGVWYMALSLSVQRIFPYRLASLSLAEAIEEIAHFLHLKANFYQAEIDNEENYQKVLESQILVNEKLDAVREQLFKNPKIVQENSQESRFLIAIFVDMVDLFEQMMSIFYNYQQLHAQFDGIGILTEFEQLIRLQGHEIEKIMLALKDGKRPNISSNLSTRLDSLKNEIQKLKFNETFGFSALGIEALENISVNIQTIHLRIQKIFTYFEEKKLQKLNKNNLYTTAFINHQLYTFDIFLENIDLKSEHFRHALRVSGMMLVGFFIAQMSGFLHSNWILLTIMVILKPAYSLSKERNMDRLKGTIGGALIGMFVLNYVHNNQLLFIILLFCMLGTYTFQRKTYFVSVLFMTPFILILFEFLGMGSKALLIERIYDTIIGGALAFIGSYLLLPHWEHKKLKKALIELLEANMAYFQEVSQLYFGKKYERTPYKIIRKEVFVRSANFNAGFQRMLSEPKNQQINSKEFQKLSVLNHLFSSYIATLALIAKENPNQDLTGKPLEKISENILSIMNDSIQTLEKTLVPKQTKPIIIDIEQSINTMPIVTQQWMNLQKVALDMLKIIEKIDLD